MLPVVLVLLCAFLVESATLASNQQSSQIIGQDFIQCIEKGKCGIESLCGFRFRKYHLRQSDNGGKPVNVQYPCTDGNLPTTPSTDTATTPRDVLQDLCTPIAEGYIFGISNDMDYPVQFSWDILDKSTNVGDGQQQPRSSGVVNVPANSIRYFTDGIHKTHTVRLFVNGEFVDRALALEQKRCSNDDTCDLLARLCYQAQEETLDDTNRTNNHTPEVEMCKVFKTECNGFSKRKSDREKDLESYLTTYYPSLYNNGGKKTKENIKSENVLECIVKSGDFQKFKDTNGNFIASHSSEQSTGGFIAAIVILSLLIVMMIVLAICWLPYCKASYWTARMNMSKDKASSPDMLMGTHVDEDQHTNKNVKQQVRSMWERQ